MFIGTEKAKEFKKLFSAWIHKIYRTSRSHCVLFELPQICPTAPEDWHLYTFNQSALDDSSAGSSPEDVDGVDAHTDASTDAQQPDLATAGSTSVVPSVAVASPSQPTTSRPAAVQINTTDDGLPSTGSTSSSDSLPTSPTEVPPHAAPVSQDQDTLDLDQAPTHPDHRAPSCGNNLLNTIDELPMNAIEPVWMKPKKTLGYFHEVHKIGKSSSLFLHWYQLEEALGFPETVSHPAT